MKIHLKNVRLSFPNLFKAKAYKEGDDPKYNATFILDTKVNALEIKQVQAGIDKIIADEFKGNAKVLKGVCLRDGEERIDEEGSFKDGYGPGTMFVTTSNPNRPQVVNRNPSIPVTAEDGTVYAGCYVNAIISLWAQSNTFGKRVNANLLAVQFVKEGDPFGQAHVKVDEEFETLDEDSDSMLD